ncbi:MAG: hypothetical protein ACJAS4_000725 [Bacteriovoracaceae bacterium]|jgi:hypothetical protein
MKDKIKYFLYKLSRYKSINQLYNYYYFLGVLSVKVILNLCPFVKHAYLKGSYGKDYFIPVISDLDFYIIGEPNNLNNKILNLLFNFLNLLFPMVADFDFHSQRDSQILFDFSGAKYFPTDSWKVLKGKEIDFTYRFYPRKFYVDIIHEIYFQFEWLFKNLKNRKSGEKLKSLVIQRQYIKIVDLINHLTLHENGYHVKKRKFQEDTRWMNYSNEKIIQKFNKLIENSYVVNRVRTLYSLDFKDRNVEEILNEDYYQTELVIISDDFNYEGHSHYFTRKNFELFYFIGSIDSYLIYDWCQFTKDDLGAIYLKALYYTRLIEKRDNSKHNVEYYYNNIGEILHLTEVVVSSIRYEKYAPKNYFGRNVLINVADREDRYHTTYLESLKKYIPVLSVKSGISEDDKIKKYNELTITRPDYCNEISNKEALFRIGINWCFGANIIIITGGNFSFKPFGLLEELDIFLDKQDFIQYTHAEKKDLFFWASTYVKWASISKFVDGNLGLNSNEFMFDLLTGIKPTTLKDQEVDLLVGDFHCYDFTVSSINKPGLVTTFEEDEKSEVLKPFLYLLHEKFKYNELKLLVKKDPNSEFWKWFYEIIEISGKDPYKELWYISQLAQSSDKQIMDNFVNSQAFSWDITGVAVILEATDDSITFRTGDINRNVPIKLKYSFKESIIKDVSMIEWDSKFQNEITVEDMRIDIRTPSVDKSYCLGVLKSEAFFRLDFTFINPKVIGPFNIFFTSNLLPNKTYHLQRENLNLSRSIPDSSFIYYKKIEKENLRNLELGLMHPGFYKIVIKLKESFFGEFFLFDSENRIEFQKFNVEKDILVIYHNNYEVTENLLISYPSKFNTNLFLTADILKKTDHFR